ncbi:nuclease-related domain-containing protein [Lysinibacillus sp. OF-1]|uniref:nuclease-related domain-containing protein n=1 Tax=Lysinibacillus sp. OF-1 TaxID=2972483 RepID=UPI00232DADD1|nr:nuclease-related domain-containing protein [Lysinibacillus sp. OF-1]WCH47010.1 NERD domain-containing protein [Lysinibacillus sp. OF-1]
MNIYSSTLAFFEANSVKIDEIYAKNLILDISGIIPLIGDDCIIVRPNLSRNNKFIKEFIGDDFRVLKEKNEIYQFIQEALGYLQVKLYNLVLQNPIGYLISLYTMLDYNIQMTPLVMGTIKNIDTNKFEDENIRILANSINTFGKSVSKNDFKDNLRYIEDLISRDKQALQKVINYIISYKLKYTHTNIQINLELEDLIELTRDIYYILTLKQEIFSNIEVASLVINNQNVVIKSEKQLITTPLGEFYDWLDNSMESKFEFNGEVNKIMREFIGVDNLIIESAIKKFLDGNNEFPGMFLFDTEKLVEFLKNYLSIDIESAQKIKNELVLDGFKISKIPNDVSLKEGRLLRQSILKLDSELYICSEPVFVFSLMGIISDITEGNIPNKEFKGKLFNFIHKTHVEFEVDVKKLLEKNTSYQFLKRGIHEMFFKEFKLPGEIDILLVIKDVAFVIECKAFALQLNLSGMLFETKKIKGISNQESIQQKLKSKIDILKEHKQVVENIVGTKIKRIEGVIITKNPSMATTVDIGFYNAIHSSQILEYIENRTYSHNGEPYHK